MKDNKVILKGFDDVLRLLNDYPNEINKIAKAALRKAIAPLVKNIKSVNPIKGSKIKIKPLKGMNPGLKFGYFGEVGNGNRLAISPWFKAYFLNYGTLKRRHPNHEFSNPVRFRKTKQRAGIRPRLFFEKSVEGKEQQVYDRFVEYLVDGVNKFLAQQK
ncbi:HK97 gp10 family phage protein [Butyricimonas synergistica]|uniref:HK97 gp10 family phage protein n=1 Tax=Butyricimonas synergistica TaxID=544644 RepID=UPI0022E329D0|nr:HK97 gp10 family phage protein [Butyricimonas synergistica]